MSHQVYHSGMLYQQTRLNCRVRLGPVGVYHSIAQLVFHLDSSLIPNSLVGLNPSYNLTVGCFLTTQPDQMVKHVLSLPEVEIRRDV